MTYEQIQQLKELGVYLDILDGDIREESRTMQQEYDKTNVLLLTMKGEPIPEDLRNRMMQYKAEKGKYSTV